MVFYAASGGLQSPLTRGIFQAYLFLMLGAYYVLCWTRGGRTLAMQAWRLRVEDRHGNPLRAGRAWLRYALAWPSVLLFGAGILWALFDRDGQFLHDRLSRTRLVSDARPTTS